MIESDASMFIDQDSSSGPHPSSDTHSGIAQMPTVHVSRLSLRTSRRDYNKKGGLQLQDSVRKALHDLRRCAHNPASALTHVDMEHDEERKQREG
eukprot:3935810-Rhodomonas_salina.4